MSKRVCVVLSGCGFLDGAEISEAVISLLALSREGAQVQVAAPDRDQMHVVNHGSQEESASEKRNVLAESNRIARGSAVALSTIEASSFDALFMPGGYGVAKNLSDFAVKGPEGSVDPDLVSLVKAFREAGKPIGAVCISPAVLVMALGEGEVTIGSDADTAGAISNMGGSHVVCPVQEAHVDQQRKLVTAPAYMENASIADVASGIEAAVKATLALA